MRNILFILIALIILIILPGGVLYLGGSFVYMSWSWFMDVDTDIRLGAVIMLITLWLIFSWLIVTTKDDDDRRDPEKKT